MTIVVEALDAPRYRAAIDGLAELLVDAVEHGAGVNFMAGVTLVATRAWWLARADQVAEGMIVPIVAFEATPAPGGSSAGGSSAGERVVGSVLLIYSATPNSPHRAEIGKVLVHSSARRRGLGRELMLTTESRARADGRWLLILDTVTDSGADTFYRSLGWNEVGQVPDFALMPDGTLTSTTYFWKSLR